MSKATHTPGPLHARKGDTLNPERLWGVVRLLSRDACIEIDGDDSQYGVRSEVVAEICAADHGQDEADAKLFAAAPDLLAALCLAVKWADSMPVDAPEEWQTWAFDARAAIAKAEGASCPRCGDSGRIVVGYGGTTGISPFFAPCDCAKAEGGQL